MALRPWLRLPALCLQLTNQTQLTCVTVIFWQPCLLSSHKSRFKTSCCSTYSIDIYQFYEIFFLGKFICSCIYNCLKTSNLSFGHHTFVLSFHRISCFVFNVKIMVLRFFFCVNFSVSRICSIKIFQNRAGNFKTLLSSLYHTLIFFSCRLPLREPY